MVTQSGGDGKLEESPSPQPSPVKGEGVVEGEEGWEPRTAPHLWIPAFAGMTVGIGPRLLWMRHDLPGG